MKKFLCTVLMAAMFLTCAPLHEFVNATDNINEISGETTVTIVGTGKCGATENDDVTWTLYDNGELVISGTGRIYYYDDSTIVPSYAPWPTKAVKTVRIEDGVTSTTHFEYHDNLERVFLADSVTSIANYAFSGRTKLTEITMSENIERIGDSAFSDCAIEKIYLPSKVSYIGRNVFNDCDKLSSIDVSENNNYFSSIDGVLFNKSKTAILKYPYGKTALSYTIPDTVQTIGGFAIDNENLEKITIPQGVKTIGEYSMYLPSVKAIYLPYGLTEIHKYAFRNCSNLVEITIPATVTKIDGHAFDDCKKLKDVYYSDTEEQWNKIDFSSPGSNNYADLYLQNALKHYEANPQFAKGYDFYKDSYSFENIDENISWSYYKDTFGIIKGTQIYNSEEKSSHGHCFGMSLSTSLMLKNMPNPNSFSGKTNINDLSVTDYSNELKLDLKKYIKYSHIYQYSAYVSDMRDSNKGFSAVYNAVKNYVENGSQPVLIDLWSDSANHTVCGIGINGNNIIVSDSNVPNRKLEIIRNENGWIYTAAGLAWNSLSGSKINYVIPTEEAYQYVKLSNYLSFNNLLVTGSTNLSYSTASKIHEVLNTSANDNNENKDTCYWLDEGVKSITVSNPTEINENIIVSSTNLSFETELQNADSASFTINEGTGSELLISNNSGDNSYITAKTASDDNEIISVTISGTTSSETLKATQTEAGFIVTGFSNVNVTLTVDNEVIDTENIQNAENIEINYNKNGNSDLEIKNHSHSYSSVTKTAPTCTEQGYTTYTCACGDSYVSDYVDVIDHVDGDRNASCDYCGELIDSTDSSNNCSHICHKSGFMGFIWKIINFFSKLFGANPICECGMAHY